MSLRFQVFASIFLGYMLMQSLYGIWMTRGLSMQVLNLIPFVLLARLPSKKLDSIPDKAESPFSLILILTGIGLLATLYFVHSYSRDYLRISRYPFIDLVSYAASAYGMKLAGVENYFSDMDLYFPEESRLQLYHYTELWFTGLASLLSGKTELWVICFVVPAFLLVMMASGITSLKESRNVPDWLLFILILSFFFGFGKLLFFDDTFLLHVLDLFGIKLSLIIPAAIFLWGLRHERNAYLAFLLFLPQINILLAIPLALLAVAGFFMWRDENGKWPARALWIAYAGYALLFLLILQSGPGNPGGPEGLTFSTALALKTFFNYGREAFFNLGFNYWGPFLALAALFRSPLYSILFIPFMAGKGLGRLMVSLFPQGLPHQAAVELMLCLFLLWRLNRIFFQFPALVEKAFAVVVFLCMLAAGGYAWSGFMDFEQIYTLAAGSLFFVLVLSLFLIPAPSKYPAILGGKTGNIMLAICLLGLIWKTIRFQKSIGFDTSFYQQIKEGAGSPGRSIYFSSRKFAPFPLHIKAGFPLLFSHPDAHSTPISMFEDSSWQGKNVAWHVKAFPFYRFATEKEQTGHSLDENKADFIRKYRIRLAWVDDTYPVDRLDFLRPAVLRIWKSEQDHVQCWLLDPGRLP